jgi:inosose dehydratase
MRASVGCGQITWRNVPDRDVLADIAEAGYEGAPLSARGGEAAHQIEDRYRRYGLRPAPGYFGGDFWDANQRTRFVAEAHRLAELSRQLGVDELYVSAGGFESRTRAGRTRRQAAAHAGALDALTDEEFDQLAANLDALGRATLDEGVRSCYHSHVGTFVETEAEIERLLAMVDPDVLFLGPDTGHLAWAGVDVLEFARRHAERIRTMHLKDVVRGIRDEGANAEWDYATFEEHGIWTEIGEGFVDFAGLLEILDGAGFDGWLIVETDVTQKSSPLESARISRENLRRLGI